jgi:sugar O-acyltransferase (sialic acid O-acetyltransferase NeuD family)
MDEPARITIPLINPNEPEALLAAVHVQEGQEVTIGQPLVTLETTKSAVDVTAERGGYIAGLKVEQGQSVRAGDVLCYISDKPGWQPISELAAQQAQAAAPDGLRITNPALAMAQKAGLDLDSLPRGPLVTEAMLRSLLEKSIMPYGDFDPTAVLIYGGGGHGKMLIEVVRGAGLLRIVGILDDGLAAGSEVMDVPVLGGGDQLAELHSRGVRLALNGVGGIGNSALRVEIFRKLARAGFAFPAVIHPSAVVEPSAVLAAGAQVFARAYVGSQAHVGFGTIVNIGAIVSHDCILGEAAAISPGAILAGEVQVGDGALVGMGATVNLRVKIGAGARVGNGATVKDDVPEGGLVRAGTIWPPDRV